MLPRYDMFGVKIWYKTIDEVDYAFVCHDIGPNYVEKIKNWNDSTQPFDKWFNQQIMAVYDASAIEANAVQLCELVL